MFTIFCTTVCNHKHVWSQADTIAEVDTIRAWLVLGLVGFCQVTIGLIGLDWVGYRLFTGLVFLFSGLALG